MATVQETADVLNTVQMLVGLVSGKLDQLIVTIQSLRAGGGISQAELDSLNALAIQVRDAAQALDAKADQALQA